MQIKALDFAAVFIYYIRASTIECCSGNAWRSRVVGRARTIGNRVTVKSGSRVRIPPSPPARRKRHVACGELFHFFAKLISHAFLLLLAFTKSHARPACSAASTLTTARCRCQLFVGAAAPRRFFIFLSSYGLSLPALPQGASGSARLYVPPPQRAVACREFRLTASGQTRSSGNRCRYCAR